MPKLPRPRLSPIVLRPKPSLFIAVREAAEERGLSMPIYVIAVLIERFEDPTIFDRSNEEIERVVRQ